MLDREKLESYNHVKMPYNMSHTCTFFSGIYEFEDAELMVQI